MAEKEGIFLANGEDIEDISPWEWDSIVKDSGNNFSLDALAKRRGNAGYKILYGGTPISDNCYAQKDTGVLRPELFKRVYVYFPSGNHPFVGSVGVKRSLYFLEFYESANLVAQLRLRGSDAGMEMYYLYGRENSGQKTDTTTTVLSLNIWHYIELEYISGAGDGRASVRLDDNIELEVTGLTNNIWTPNTIRVGGLSNSYNVGAGEYFYIDDIKVDIKYIGEYKDLGKMTPWLVKSRLAGVPGIEAARMIPPSIVSVAKDAGEPSIGKVDRPLTPKIDRIKGPF